MLEEQAPQGPKVLGLSGPKFFGPWGGRFFAFECFGFRLFQFGKKKQTWGVAGLQAHPHPQFLIGQ